jgi:hypothetical protein
MSTRDLTDAEMMQVAGDRELVVAQRTRAEIIKIMVKEGLLTSQGGPSRDPSEGRG